MNLEVMVFTLVCILFAVLLNENHKVIDKLLMQHLSLLVYMMQHEGVDPREVAREAAALIDERGKHNDG